MREGIYSMPAWFRRLTVRQVVMGLALALLALVTTPLWVSHLLPDSLVYFSELRGAGSAIAQIEHFRRANGALPADLCQFGLPCDESAPLHYDKRENGVYLLWFAAPTHGFFSTLVYDSGEGAWHVGQ